MALGALAGNPIIPAVRAIQRTMWNWDGATIDLLLEIQSKDRTRWKKIEEVLDLNPERGKSNMIWSKALGISREDKVGFSKAGRMLEQRPDILNRLHALLGIRERNVFEPGVDFREQIERAKEGFVPVEVEMAASDMDPDPLDVPEDE